MEKVSDLERAGVLLGCPCSYCQWLRGVVIKTGRVPPVESPLAAMKREAAELGIFFPDEQADQWREVADARERQERTLKPGRLLTDHESAANLYRLRRARVNDELWLNDELPEIQPPTNPSLLKEWRFWFLIGGLAVCLWSLFVLSCGGIADGGCWK